MEISRWCQAYLELQYSADIGRHYAQLLKVLGEIANVPRDGIDRFDWLKGREEEVSRQLAALADAFAAHTELQQQRQTQPADRSPPHTTYLFVYGTLKRGYRRSGALAEQRFIGTAQTLPQYKMYDCGGYPALVPDPQGVAVEGELWEISGACLHTLDDIEGVHLNLYQRQSILLDQPYRGWEVQSYFYCRDTSGLGDCGTCWHG